MRRIYITKHIIELSKDYTRKLFIERQEDFDFPINNLTALESNLRTFGYTNFADYTRKIIVLYPIINRIRPQYFMHFHDNFFSNLSFTDLKTSINISGHNMQFYNHIVKAMRYDAIRDKEFLPYVQRLGIKTCVYCNSQFAITTEDGDGDITGKYELDHFLPKSKYPFLCTSFFNLQPSCTNCNKSKKDNQVRFGLYTDDYKELAPFHFKIQPKSLVKYMLWQNSENLEIIFDSHDTSLKNDHERYFHISHIYKTHKDVAEEIIWKAKIYNDSYKESLRESFRRLFPKTTDINRFLLGNYDQPHQCHKRPLSKFMQDIAKQLNLI